MSWSPKGDRIAYFVRTEKERALILQNVVTGEIEQRFPMKTVDEPESPAIAPDGKHVVFSGLSGAVGDLFMIDTDTGKVENLTKDAFADYGPTFSPDGKYLIYMARISGNEKLFRLDLDTRKKTQITFGTHDDAQAKFIDDHTLVFASTAVNPTQPLEPEVAKNGNIFNIWTLDMKTGELRQYTDAVAGNACPVVLNGEKGSRIAFVTYFKGEFGVHTLERKEPLQTALVSDFGEGGSGLTDFQAPLTHTLVAENKKKKGAFEKLFLEGRPPVNVGVTSGGDIFGGTQITFSDVLGDKQFNFFAASISQYRTLVWFIRESLAAVPIRHPGVFANRILLRSAWQRFLRPVVVADHRPRSGAGHADVAGRQRLRHLAVQPVSAHRGLGGHRELQGRVRAIRAWSSTPRSIRSRSTASSCSTTASRSRSGSPTCRRRLSSASSDRWPGTRCGSVMRWRRKSATPCRDRASTRTCGTTSDWEARGCWPSAGAGFKSWGDAPSFNYFGGNSDLRGYEYLQFIGNNTFYGNAELRFPLIEAMLTPIGILGGVRGVFFAGAGGAFFNNQSFKFWENKTLTGFKPITGYNVDPVTGDVTPIEGPPLDITGFRLVDGRASYGFGLETFALGFPIHFDWAWRTLFNKSWEDALFAANGGSEEFRRPQFKVWVGYDF